MATTNPPLSRSWSLVVAAAVDRALITPSAGTVGALIEIAVTADDVTAPTVSGHLIADDRGVTRDLLGDGAIWARIAPSSHLTSAVLVVT